MGKLIFIWAPASLHCLPLQGCWEPSDLSDSDDIDEAVDTSYHFQTCSPGTAMEAEVVVAPGLFYVYYHSSPSEAGKAIVYGLNWHLLEYPFGKNLPCSQI